MEARRLSFSEVSLMGASADWGEPCRLCLKATASEARAIAERAQSSPARKGVYWSPRGDIVAAGW